MKKIASLLLGICLFLSACGSTSENLVREDFHVFQEGKVVLKLTPQQEFFSFVYDAPPAGLPADALATSRGIQLGSSLEEISKGYANIPVMVFAEDMPREMMESLAEVELADHLKELAGYDELILVYDCFEVNGRPVYTREEFAQMVRDKKVTSSDAVYYLDIMLFVKGGKTSNISLAAKDISQMLQEYMK